MKTEWTIDRADVAISVTRTATSWTFGKSPGRCVEIHASAPGFRIKEGKKTVEASASFDGKTWWLWIDGRHYRAKPQSNKRTQSGLTAAVDSEIRAPMTGTIREILIQKGTKVVEGEPLVKMEAMKMEYTLVSPGAGVITKLNCKVGMVAEADQILVEIHPSA